MESRSAVSSFPDTPREVGAEGREEGEGDDLEAEPSNHDVNPVLSESAIVARSVCKTASGCL